MVSDRKADELPSRGFVYIVRLRMYNIQRWWFQSFLILLNTFPNE